MTEAPPWRGRWRRETCKGLDDSGNLVTGYTEYPVPDEHPWTPSEILLLLKTYWPFATPEQRTYFIGALVLFLIEQSKPPDKEPG